MRLRSALLACTLALGPRQALASGPVEPRVAVRSGDVAPATARFGEDFGCRLTMTPDGALLFVDAAGTAIFRRQQDGQAETLVFAGQGETAGGRFAAFCETATGGDGTVAFHALLADGRDGIFRIAPGGTSAEVVVLTGDTLVLPSGPVTAGVLAGPAVAGDGAVVVSVDFIEGVAAVVAFPPGGAPAVLIQTGDTLGSGAFRRSPTAPAANTSGQVAFTATLDTDRSAIGLVAPGAPAQALFEDTQNPGSGQPPLTVDLAATAINDLGQVAFLWSLAGAVRVQRAGPGAALLVGPNSQAPGGGAFTEVTGLGPSIDAAGDVLFGARRSDGRLGLYVVGSQGVSVVTEEGAASASGETLTTIGARDSDPRPAFGPDGSVWFTARTVGGGGIFSAGSGLVRAGVRSGDPIPDPVRFASFLETAIPVLGGGPSLAPGGAMIFDARVTGGSRGLFVRDPGGPLTPVALDGDPAPGGGTFDGDTFAFHSLSRAGAVVFIGGVKPSAPSGAPPAGPALFYGRRGAAGGFSLGRVIGAGDPEPAGLRTVAGLEPPSRLNGSGAFAVPVVLSDGRTALFGYDGVSLSRIVATGDPAPSGSRFTGLFTGSLFLGTPLPPVLADDGAVLFGATTGDGDSALFLAGLQPGGGGVPQRVVGEGDGADGALFSPFELQSLDRDAAGRVALGAIFDDNFDFGAFLKDGPSVQAAARPFDSLGDVGFIFSVAPPLALAGDGGLAYEVRLFGGRQAILLRGAAGASAGNVDAAQPAVIAEIGEPSADGGLYRAFQGGPRSTARLSSDGHGRIAFAAATDTVPEEIVLYGAPANSPPVADAGPDQVVECSGPAGATVRLDGTASHDPDGDPLTYVWTGAFGQATGAQPVVVLPLGTGVVTLVVSDGQASSSPASVTITVRDTLPPSLSVAATPALLWPPDGRMQNVSLAVTASDVCDPQPAVTLVNVTMQDGASRGRPGPSVLGAELGTDDRLVALRAERSGAGAGRSYILLYRAADRSGNAATAAATVIVPHDLGR